MSTRKRKIPAEENNDSAPLPKAAAKPKSKCHYRLCSVPGCTKQVQQGGVCCRHGAKTTRASCSHEECTNVAKRGGLCRRHGAFKLETCSSEGCKRVAKKGEFCDVHTPREDTKAVTIASSKKVRASTKTCIHEGCSNKAKRGGVCSKHDVAKRPIPAPSSVQMSKVDETNTLNNNNALKVDARWKETCNHDGGTNIAEESGDGQLDFLCDYYEELYEPLPIS
mmetsp:Transcript_25308/g.54464  ORF Transcript_25308/g.54464 Transcript_25308/m.54464 type:complete len:223 (+) Transcript_25308:138-806(+)|eukprot:CAMPEP_0172316380 /NCGR_PEP_ID=MMETSP1058-20130122/27972_1 /TAXON_ID=83371 /ORGANISM="Detonula confervacea, Strain CCMP 353" /LENGTH=222 /DNA_ID=CAMNT_0013030673 /DNA_START=112 /DNA_END=780 /DNA_ORIENTATION=-